MYDPRGSRDVVLSKRKAPPVAEPYFHNRYRALTTHMDVLGSMKHLRTISRSEPCFA
jgi:hypothetical protein